MVIIVVIDGRKDRKGNRGYQDLGDSVEGEEILFSMLSNSSFVGFASPGPIAESLLHTAFYRTVPPGTMTAEMKLKKKPSIWRQ